MTDAERVPYDSAMSDYRCLPDTVDPRAQQPAGSSDDPAGGGLAAQLDVELGEPRDVTSGASEAGDEAGADGIGGEGEHDRDCLRLRAVTAGLAGATITSTSCLTSEAACKCRAAAAPGVAPSTAARLAKGRDTQRITRRLYEPAHLVPATKQENEAHKGPEVRAKAFRKSPRLSGPPGACTSAE